MSNSVFVPSKYQEAIFDWVKNGKGSAMVEATAGSGKTSTIIASLKLVPMDKKVLLCAFNKLIAEELKKRVKIYPNVQATTMNGIGYQACMMNNPKIKMDFNKLGNIITKIVNIEFKNTGDKAELWGGVRKLDSMTKT